MPELDATLTRPRLDATVVIGGEQADGGDAAEAEQEKPTQLSPIFALASLNPRTAPSAEVRWSQLLAISLAPEGEPLLTVGRAKDCRMQLLDARVSQRHFEILVRRKAVAFECFLNDCSSNGTAVNGAIVGKGHTRQLRSGDEICVLPAHRVGDDAMIAFVFRNATEHFAEPEQVRSLELEELVTCPICMQAIYKCVALTPCSHNFCMACLSDWMRRKKDCPVCRRHFTAVMKNHPMDAVIEAWLDACPKARRPEEELREMDARDQLRLGQSGKLVREVLALQQPTQSRSVFSEGVPMQRAMPTLSDSDRRSGSFERAPGSQVCALQ